MSDEAPKKKSNFGVIFLVVMLIAGIGKIWDVIEAPPKTLEAARKAAIGVWINDGLVMDRIAKTEFKADGTYISFMAVKGDKDWGSPETGSWKVKETELMLENGNTEKAFEITWKEDGMTAEYVFEKKNSVYNRSQVMRKRNQKTP